MQMLEWATHVVAKGGQWILEQGITGLLTLAGHFSRFMTEQCTEAFYCLGLLVCSSLWLVLERKALR